MIEPIFFSVFFFLFGTTVGSFLNVVTLRVPKRKRIDGRSICPHCKKIIAWYDLIPVFSFLLLGGRCRMCKKKISLQYPMVEVALGFLFAVGYFVLGFTLPFFLYLIFTSFLLAIFVLDFRHYIIPDFLSIPLLLFGIFGSLVMWIADSDPTVAGLSAAMANIGLGILVGGGFFLLQFWISGGRWVGGGDVRLGAAMGAMLGFPVVVAALGLSYAVGAFWSVALIALKRKTVKGVLPFGTFLAASTVVCLLWGQEIVDGYLRFIGF